jgi:hypothetical protein
MLNTSLPHVHVTYCHNTRINRNLAYHMYMFIQSLQFWPYIQFDHNLLTDNQFNINLRVIV